MADAGWIMVVLGLVILGSALVLSKQLLLPVVLAVIPVAYRCMVRPARTA